MKNLILLSLILIGCNGNKPKTENSYETDVKIDSIIQQSQKNISTVDSTNKKSDSTITGKVEKTIKQISSLKEENKKLKIENNVLKVKLNDIDNSGKPFELLPVSNN